MRNFLIILLFSMSTLAAAQKKSRVIYGSMASLKGQTTVGTEYTYDSMIIGTDKPEKVYVDEKKKSWDVKEAGKGDAFESMWLTERKNRYEPTFDHYIYKTTGLMVNKGNPTYTFIIKTRRTEPGWNAGVAAKGGEVDAEVWLVESADKTKVLAKIILTNQNGGIATGGDFEIGMRLQAAYMEAAKSLGRHIIKVM
jgi:hypothetical protein